MILCALDRIGRAKGLGAALDLAIDWLASGAWKDLPDGRLDIDGDRVYALVSSYPTRPSEALRWETHRRYVDFQMLLEGWEYVYVREAGGLGVEEAYDKERDIAFWLPAPATMLPKVQRISLEPGLVAVLFPEDAHAPCAATTRPEPVRKLVIKAELPDSDA